MAQEIEPLAEQLEALLQRGQVDELVQFVASTHPADQADIFRRLEPELRRTFVSLLSAEGQARLLEYLDEEERQGLARQMPRDSLARVLDKTANDVAADVLRRLPAAEAARVLSTMAAAPDVTPLLGHADTTAGGLMTRGFVALHREMTAQEAINYLRLRRPQAEEYYYLYVLDEENLLQGVVNLRALVTAPPQDRIGEIMAPDVIAVAPGTDQEEAARLIQRYRLRALPVVDAGNRLLGITTIDDLMAVASEEATEDMQRMVGLPGDESLATPLVASVRRRLSWLFLSLPTAFLAAAIVNAFEKTIEQAAALAIFMPIIAGQGGNAGVQTLTLVVRGLALGEVDIRDVRGVLGRELAIALIKGVTFGLVVGVIAWAWKQNPALGLVAGAAMMANMVVAGLVGTLVPIVLRWLRLDPAIASGIFVTTFTDVLGFLTLLGLATFLIAEIA
ncbi:MAG: magnesium transporter [Dehalococcoidia bacterium]